MKVTKDEMCLKSVELFKQKGFMNVSVSDICKEFGVTRGSFYHHFTSKEDLLLYWQKRRSDLSHHFLSVSDDLNSYEKIKFFLKRYSETIASLGPELLYATMQSEKKEPENSYVIGKTTIQSLTPVSTDLALELIQQAQQDGFITNQISSETLMLHYNIALMGLSFDWYKANGTFDFVEEASKISKTIFR